MNLQWARIFLAVLDSGSFAAAARRLHMSQPAVSMAVTAMEEQVGQTLLVRSPGQRSPIQPTRAGSVFREYCRRFLALRDEMQVELLRDKHFSSFLVASTPTPGSVVMPHLTSSFREAFPQLKFSMRAFSGNEIVQRLRSGEFDIAITGDPSPAKDIISTRFFHDPMELIVPKHMKLDEVITPRHLQKLPLIVRNQKCYSMSVISQGLEDLGYPLSEMNILMQVYGNSDVLQAVAMGSGVGFVTRSLMASMPQYSDKVKIVSVKRLQLDRHLHLLRLKDRPYTDGMELFWNYALGTRWREGKFSYNTMP